MTTTPYHITIVSHTHWDREWYQPFQVFRFRLVELIDQLLNLLDRDPQYRSFLLDGQTIVLEDYLEMRPEREADLRRHIAAGRLLIGPWHILPDEFLVGPEATVRNLLLGAKVCARFGARLPIGYTPDPFGHISQLPQILVGCGLEAAALQRGLADEPTELWWEAPDGTRLLTIYFREGYGNLAWAPTTPEAFTRTVERQIERLAPHGHTPYLLLLNGTDHMMPQPELPALIAAANERLAGRAVLVHGTLPDHVARVKAHLGDGVELPVVRGELRSSKRSPVLPGVYSARMWIKQRNHACETALERYAEPVSALAWLSGGADRRGQLWRAWRYLIENHPHDSICGCSVDQVHEEMRTRFDWSEQIARQVTAAGLVYLAQQIDVSRLPAPPEFADPDPPALAVISAKSDYVVLVYNPLAQPQTGPVEVTVPWPGPGQGWYLLDYKGQPVPYRVVDETESSSQTMEMGPEEWQSLLEKIEVGFYGGRLINNVRVWLGEKSVRLEMELREYHTGQIGSFVGLVRELRSDPRLQGCQHFRVTTHLVGSQRLSFMAADIPGVGYACYRLSAVPQAVASGTSLWQPADAARPLVIENEWFRVEAAADGTLTVLEKETGQVLSGLNRLEDGGDRGDEYNYCPPAHDVRITTPQFPPGVEYRDDGPFGQCLIVRSVYALPADLTSDRNGRSAQRVEMPVTTTVRVMPGVRRVDVRTELNNQALNHRLRVLFPTGCASDTAIVDGHFDRLKRRFDPPADTVGWAEQPAPTAAQRAFTAVEENGQALLVATRGLPEYELLHNGAEATIAVTLLRAVGWLSLDDLDCRPGHAGPKRATPGAQCLGPAVFEYSIVPFGGAFRLPEAAHQAYAFVAPLQGVAVESSPGTRSPVLTLLTLYPPELVLTALKPAEEGAGIIARFFNSSEEAVTGRLQIGLPVTQARLTNLLEEPVGEALAVDGEGRLSLEVPPKRIVSLRLDFVPGD